MAVQNSRSLRGLTFPGLSEKQILLVEIRSKGLAVASHRGSSLGKTLHFPKILRL